MRLLAAPLCLVLLGGCPSPPAPGCEVDTQCVQGLRCVASRCLPAACGDRPCRSGEACVEGICRAADCALVSCPAGQGCAQGRCFPIDCSGRTCILGDVCASGTCQEPSCLGVTCGPDQLCANGLCRSTLCEGVVCASGDVCETGRCVSTRCIGVVCGPGTACLEGRCLPSDCGATRCAPGEACLDGACVDPGCVHGSCAPGHKCVRGACFACASRESTCTAALDDDCDGLTGCADPDCERLPCNAEEFCSGGTCGGPQADAGSSGRDAGRRDAGGCAGSERLCRGVCLDTARCCENADCQLTTDRCDQGTCGCGPGAPCSGAEVCHAGVCAPGCWIAGLFHAAGEASPANACQVCQPAASTTDWTVLPDGSGCAPGKVCLSAACQSGCWISGAPYPPGAPNPARAWEECRPPRSTTTWTQVRPAPDGFFAKTTPTSYACGGPQATGTARCVAELGAGYTWPDLSLGLHEHAYEAAKREPPNVSRDYFVFGSETTPGYYTARVGSASGSAGRGSSFACPASRRLLCVKPAHSTFLVTPESHPYGSTSAYDSVHDRIAVFYVTQASAGSRALAVQLLTGAGGLVGEPVALSSGFGDLNGPGDGPAIHADFDPVDQRYRLFYSKGDAGAGHYGLYSLVLDADGAPLAPERTLETGLYDLSNAFDVGVDRANRRYLLVYYFTDLSTYALRGRYLAADGTLGPPFDLEADNYNVTTLAVTSLADTFFVAYRNKAGTALTVKTLSTGATSAKSTNTVAAPLPSRLRLAAGASNVLLAYGGGTDVYTQLLAPSGAASGAALRVNAFAGSVPSLAGLEVGWDAVGGRYLVGFNEFLQALTPANARALSTVEERIAAGTSGVVQSLVVLPTGAIAVLHRQDASPGQRFTRRLPNLDTD